MILVSILSTEDEFEILLKHKINFVVEKVYKKTKTLNNRTHYVFVQLFYSIIKLIYIEIFLR